MTFSWPFWVSFHAFVFFVLALDLTLAHRKPHAIQFREAIAWSGVWIGFALLFNLGLYLGFGKTMALEFLTGYLVEKSLSVDNIFVFLTLFSYFRIPKQFQHKVLFWGVLGALVMRAGFIFAGVELIEHFHPIIYVFGTFLIFTGIKMAFQSDKPTDLGEKPIVQLIQKFIRISPQIEGGKFFVHKGTKKYATPLFLVLVLIEITDLIFALDSIPAVLSVTQSSFIAYTSNIFAILGLRSLYFAVAGFIELFHYLHYGLALILVFIGVKMLISDYYTISTGMTLGFIFVVLSISIFVSLKFRKR